MKPLLAHHRHRMEGIRIRIRNRTQPVEHSMEELMQALQEVLGEVYARTAFLEAVIGAHPPATIPPDEIVLKTGAASITLKRDGTITIKGKDITIDGSGKVNIKASGDLTMKGSKIQQN